ncbi:MAG: beta-ketoacyl-[acyl-carrier-protein] synthase family protein [Planctomycetes bacterium]|nr:beta-ketoacyl-[acyl-carrier-protein] synthase family protein [Planctomycetota bacterium]
MQEVVFTGLGIVCPLGIGREAVWSAVADRRSGVRRIDRLAETNLPSPLGGEVLDFEPKQHVKPRKSLKVMSRETQLGFTAAKLAWEDAALDDAIDPERLGVVVGANNLRSRIDDLADLYRTISDGGQFDMARWGTGMREMYPLWMLKYLPNMICCHIGIALDARGPINTILHGEVSALMAIIEAADVIARGQADVMLAGGASSMLEMIDLSWRGGIDMSRNLANPAKACRPFDAARDGAVASEGATMFVLESREHADKRGAVEQARVLGYGRRNEPCAISQKPTGQAVRQAIEAALAMGGISANELGHVNAHGVGTLEDDAMEARAIEQVLGDVPVTAPKSFFGNLGAASGAAELAISLLGMKQGVTPPTLNYEHPDPACPVNVVSTSQPARSPNILALNHRRTGQAVSLLVSAER